MRILIDTNVLISSEPTRSREVEIMTRSSLALARQASGRHQLLVHPSVSDEIANDSDDERRELRKMLRKRYATLDRPPPIQDLIIETLGSPPEGSHDWFDHELLACVVGDAVHWLVTQDSAIHRKARRLGVEDRVHFIEDAVATLQRIDSEPAGFVPSVDQRPLHALDLGDPFFDSLKSDYRDFEAWYRNISREGREAFVIDGPDKKIAGLCIFKGLDAEIGIGQRPAKVSTFKVAEEFKGSRYGELLLKILFVSTARKFDVLWLTVFPKQEELIALLELFGFQHHDDYEGERRYIKFVGSRTVYSSEEVDAMVRHGPVLVFLFRQDRFVDPPIPLAELIAAKLINSAPQTTIGINPEGLQWLTERLDV